MNNNLKKLIEVNLLDLEVSKYNPLIEEKKAPVYAKTNEKTLSIKEKEELQAKIEQSQERLSKSNEELAVISADIDKIKARIKDSKSEKEMKNLDMEEGILREKSVSFNNEIESLEREIKASKERIMTLDSNIVKLDEEILAIESSCKDAVNEIKTQQDSVSAKRQMVALQMEATVLRLYEKIRKWAGNSSVIAMYKEACGGCFIKLNDKSISDIRKGDDIIHCPHCGRILYDADMLEAQDNAK